MNKKTGIDLDTAAKHLNENIEKDNYDHDCEFCNDDFADVPGAIMLLLRALDHTGPEGFVVLGYNEPTRDKYKAIFKKEKINDDEFFALKKEQDEKSSSGGWFRREV